MCASESRLPRKYAETTCLVKLLSGRGRLAEAPHLIFSHVDRWPDVLNRQRRFTSVATARDRHVKIPTGTSRFDGAD